MKNRKFYFIILAIALALLFTACNDGLEQSASVDDGDNPDYILDGITLSNQVDIFLENEDRWIIESEFELPVYCVTDLDKNGRIELISAINQGTGLYTSFYIYEINDTQDDFYEVSMKYEEGDSLPDVISDSGIAYFNEGTSEWIYIVCDKIRNGAAECWHILNTLELYDGEILIEPIAQKHTVFDTGGNEKNEYKDYSGETITEDEFSMIADTAYGTICEKYEINYLWFSALNDNNKPLGEDDLRNSIMESYESFIFSKLAE